MNRVLSVAVGVLLLTSCGFGVRDTCTDGVTFVDPQVVYDQQSVTLMVTWEPGTGRAEELPDAYFDEFKIDVVTGLDAQVIGATRVGARAMEVTLEPGIRASKFRILFEDREQWTDCQAPGAGDGYALEVVIVLDDQGSLVRSSVEDLTLLGHF